MISSDPVLVSSEIGHLETVIIHTPGDEVELMTPENAHEALYSDILNKDVAQSEHAQFSGALRKITQVLQVNDLLHTIVEDSEARASLIHRMCEVEPVRGLQEYLDSLSTEKLVKCCIEGVQFRELAIKSEHEFALKPLYNLFFTRDASMTVNNRILVADMNYPIRQREAIMMNVIYHYHPLFRQSEKFSLRQYNPLATIEGGDLHILRDDIYLLGIHPRTNTAGVQAFIDAQSAVIPKFQLITFELPTEPASFIHLDMVFTLLDRDECMIYAPLILHDCAYKTLRTQVDGKRVTYHDESNLLTAIQHAGMDLKPLYCGGRTSPYAPQREQWHSGANFFGLGPGKVIGYARNHHTIDVLSQAGYRVIPSTDIISGKVDFSQENKAVITIPGAELSRGGGGCRCMTMPIKRQPL